MAKGTLIFIFFLAIIATLLFGINVGKKLNLIQSQQQTSPTPRPTPSLTTIPTIANCAPPDECVPRRECYIGRWKEDHLCVQTGQDIVCCATLTPTPVKASITPTPLIAKPKPKVMGSSYIDEYCGFSFTIPAGFVRQQSQSDQAGLFVDSVNSKNLIAATCAETIPRPPLSSDKIEATILNGKAATFYHDRNPDGSLRDEVIVKHPNNNLEIIIAGYGLSFQNTLTSFRFIQ